MNFLRRWQSLIICVVASVLVASTGAVLTNLDDWYFQLKQPGWKPPDAAFGLIWTAIFSLAAASAWLSWNAAYSHKKRVLFLSLYLVNAVLNVCWTVLYFQLHRPDWSLIECFFLWISVLSLIVFQWSTSRLASALVVPYLIWVSIATVLNWETVILNGF